MSLHWRNGKDRDEVANRVKWFTASIFTLPTTSEPASPELQDIRPVHDTKSRQLGEGTGGSSKKKGPNAEGPTLGPLTPL